MQQGIVSLAQGNDGVDGKAKLDAALFVPVVVNCAFACELFIKSMLPPSTIPKGREGHLLDYLFDQLDSNLKQRIRNATVDKVKEHEPSYCDTDFQNDLSNNNDIFAKWRYFHEGNSSAVNFQFITCFIKSLFEIINEER